MIKIELTPAFILHTRPYRNSSLLLELFTHSHGRMSVIARGAKSKKTLGLMQPFVPLLISAVGKQDLLALQHVEARIAIIHLTAKKLLSGLYLNELLIRLLHRQDAYPELFRSYEKTLYALMQDENIEASLRVFELSLLKELGYELPLARLINSDEIVERNFYRFQPETGFILEQSDLTDEDALALNLFSGKYLLALYQQQLHLPDTLKAAKRLLRLALRPLLANKPLLSRELFSSC